jgi:hypothetical protein
VWGGERVVSVAVPPPDAMPQPQVST